MPKKWKPIPWIFLLLTCFCHPARSSAQLWRYLKNDSKADEAAERSLDSEACSVVTRSELY